MLIHCCTAARSRSQPAAVSPSAWIGTGVFSTTGGPAQDRRQTRAHTYERTHMKYARALLYLSPVVSCLVIVCASVYSYSWASTFVNLACSIQDDSFYYFVPGWNAAHGSGFTVGGEKT